MKAGIVSRTDIPKALSVTRRVFDYLKENGVDVEVESDTALALKINNNINLSELSVDFVVTVGGDGTILRTAMELGYPETPILGINMGRRGFLSEVTVPEAEWAIDKVLDQDYYIENMMKLSSKCLQTDEVYSDSLNEVLIASSFPSKMLVMGLYIDDEHVTDIQADGAIVSTPAGSTAYNMSAGGSIVVPEVEAISLTAICPYSYFKSLVVPRSSRIRVELLKPRAEGLAIIDGRAYNKLKPLSSVECWVSEHETRFIRFKSFYSRIHKRINILQTQ
jgi:NAD+ kinase